MIVKANAKINLALNILNKNGEYHDLDMVMLPLELHDSIDITLLPHVYDTYVTCDDFSLETNQYNLASIAVNKMKEHFKIDKSFRIHIHKNIPMSAGLAGGSANAAAVIRGIIELCKLKPTKEELIDIAKSIGADVTYCLFNKPARATGIGEKLQFIHPKNRFGVMLIKPKKGLSTKTVFHKYDEIGKKDNKATIENVIKGIEENDLDLLATSVGNDLEESATTLLPEINDIKQMMKDSGFKVVLMSGSGSSVFAIYNLKEKVNAIERKFIKLGYDVIITKTLDCKEE